MAPGREPQLGVDPRGMTTPFPGLPGPKRWVSTEPGQLHFGSFGRLMELTGGTFQVESLDMLANDRGGVFVDRLTAERNGRKLDVVRLLLYVAIRGGQIVEGLDHFHQEHLRDALPARWPGRPA